MNELILTQLKEDIQYAIEPITDRYELKIKSLKIIDTGKSLSDDKYKVIEKSENIYSFYISCVIKLSKEYQNLSAPQVREFFLQVGGALNTDFGALVVNYELSPLRLDLQIEKYTTI